MVNIERLFAGLSSGGRKERRRMTVAAAREALAETEIERLFPPELITREAIKLAEQNGYVGPGARGATAGAVWEARAHGRPAWCGGAQLCCNHLCLRVRG